MLFEMGQTKPIKSNEWYTPSKYIEAAREVMGGIDLDPASCALANEAVKATRYHTIDDDGLSKEWRGNVWCNPPFTASISCRVPQFAWGSKLIDEYRKGHVAQAILLIMAASKQRWFHDLWGMHDGPVCFCATRIHFTRPGNCTQELRESTCFVYLGPNETKFVEVFSQFGTVATRVGSASREQAFTQSLWPQ